MINQMLLAMKAGAAPTVIASGTITVDQLGNLYGYSVPFVFGSNSVITGEPFYNMWWHIGTGELRIEFDPPLASFPPTITLTLDGISVTRTADPGSEGYSYGYATPVDPFSLASKVGLTLNYTVTV